MSTNLQIDTSVNANAQSVKDQDGGTTSLALSTDKVGIGTANPSAKLEIVGDWTGEEGALRLTGDKPTIKFSGKEISGNQSWILHVGSNGPGNFEFFRKTGPSQWSDVMALAATGNVGIGTTNPSQRLTLGTGNLSLPNANAGVDGNLYFGGITDTGEVGMRLFGGKINEGLQSGFIDVRSGTLADGLRIRVDTFSGGTERMRITASGNVGIGTPDPLHLLQIGGGFDGHLGFGGSEGTPNAGYIRFGDYTGWKFHIARAREGSAGPINTGTTGSLVTFQDNGNVGIGTTAPTEKLEVNGSIKVSGDILLANADCAEDFTIGTDLAVEPGTVMIVGAEGALFPCSQAYDKKVAGVVSGAGDYKPGIVLDKQQSESNRQPIALLGKVYCKVDAQYGAIEIGDSLTTSPTPGHAMKVEEPLAALGAMLGKALRPLNEGQGLIPILIALQ
ncbi:MAG: hypothetical protein ACU836_16345 [Gammaproteobacteria bacterium]